MAEPRLTSYVVCSLGLGTFVQGRRRLVLPQEEGWRKLRKLLQYVPPLSQPTLSLTLSSPVSANIITCASFAPSETRLALSQSADPVFSNGHTHLAPLRATMSGASLAAFPSTASRLMAVASTDSGTPSAAEDSIIIVADDTTGVISVFRNSVVAKEESTSRKAKRASRAPSEA